MMMKMHILFLLVMFTFSIISPTLNPQQVGVAGSDEIEVVSLDK